MPRSNTKPVAAAKRKRPTEDAAEEVSAAFVAVANGVSERGLPDLEDSDEEGVPEIVNESGDEEDGVTGSNSDTEDDGEVGFTPDASEDESASEQGDEDDFVHGTEVSVPFPVATTVVSNITGRPKRVYPDIEPDYDSDSSTEDDPNRIGNVPLHWYDDMPHIGYSIDGKKVFRPARGDELDKFLSTVDDPSSWTAAFDKNAQKDTQLSPEELDLIRRLQKGENPDADYDPYEPTIEWFTGKGKEEVMPLSSAPEPKRRWVPSKWEKQKVMKIVRAIRQGRIIPAKPTTASTKPQFYAIWNEPSSSTLPGALPAPKVRLPTHAESYNPPEEYVPTEEERKTWEDTDPADRERDFLPRKHGALRLVPGYDRFVQERFGRQLDLYLAPRVQRARLNIDPESLVPKLPSPASLRPFPAYRALELAHTGGRVRALAVSPDGAWAVSADEGGAVSLWEVLVGREVKRWTFAGRVGAAAWCPRTDVACFAVGVEDAVHVLVPPHLPPAVLKATQALLAPAELPSAPPAPSPVRWVSTSANTHAIDTPILTLRLPEASGVPRQLTWHRRGDYVASVSGAETNGGVWIHQLSRRHSQAPFKKVKGAVQLVLFHPIKPHFFVATQRYVRMYDLAEQKLLKTLTPGSRWISSMDVHPSGDHLIVGGYDRKLCWFDLELSSRPYKVLRYHTRALRAVAFHPTYPLFASAADDGSVQVFHAKVFADLMTDPLIVPLKILRGHAVRDGLGVLQLAWVPRQPFLLSAGADGTVGVWCA